MRDVSPLSQLNMIAEMSVVEMEAADAVAVETEMETEMVDPVLEEQAEEEEAAEDNEKERGGNERMSLFFCYIEEARNGIENIFIN